MRGIGYGADFLYRVQQAFGTVGLRGKLMEAANGRLSISVAIRTVLWGSVGSCPFVKITGKLVCFHRVGQ